MSKISTLSSCNLFKLSSKDLLELGVIDEIIPEPLGGAHRDRDVCLNNTRELIQKNLDEMNSMSRDEIFSHRKKKFLSIGRNKGFTSSVESDKNLTVKESLLQKIILKLQKFKFQAIALFFLLIAGLIYLSL